MTKETAPEDPQPTVTGKGETRLYLGDLIAEASNGCRFDLRAKLAIEFLKAGVVPTSSLQRVSVVPGDPQVVVDLTVQGRVAYALDLGEAIIAEAEKRGLLLQIPDNSELPKAMRNHIDRQVRAQVLSQLAGQRIMKEEGPKVVQAPPG